MKCPNLNEGAHPLNTRKQLLSALVLTLAVAAANPARSTFMTMNNEVLKIASNVTAADVGLPAGFKERN